MHVYAIPPHSDHPRSLVCVGPRGTEGICATIENIVRGECDVFPEFPPDPHRRPDTNRAHGRWFAPPPSGSASPKNQAALACGFCVR